jgi:hypothetical protein
MGQLKLFRVRELFAELSEGAGLLRRRAPSPMERGLPIAGVSAISLLVATTSPSVAQSVHDGRWSVVVITEQGACDVYRWEFDVRRGQISPTRDAVATAAGGISPRGEVKVTFTRGSDTLSAAGAVTGAYGRGRWSSPTRQCSGRWQAEKRG